jgi:hypothetical protein
MEVPKVRTPAWDTIVRLKYPHLVIKHGFVMAELVFKQSIPNSPLIPEFAAAPAFLEAKLLIQGPNT